MGKLASALPRQRVESDQAPNVKSDRGVYSGLWVGATTPFEWVSNWPGERCRLCKGQGTGYNGEGICAACHGTCKRTEQRIKMMYLLDTGILEEEEMNYKLAPAGMSKGDPPVPLSPTTFYVRLRALSGLKDPTVEELDEWYSALPEPPNVPCTVIINDNKSQTYLKITDVMKLSGGNGAARSPAAQSAAAAQPAPAAEQRTFTPGGSKAETTKPFEPAKLDERMNNEIVDLASKLDPSFAQWTALLALVDGELIVGKTTMQKASLLRAEIIRQIDKKAPVEDDIPL